MSHPIVHIELSAMNHSEAGHFYAQVFGWETREFPGMSYTTASFGNEQLGVGFNPIGEGVPAGATVVYIYAEDIAETMAKIEAHGGQRTLADQEIPGVGTIAMFKDPTGNLMALLKPAEMA